MNWFAHGSFQNKLVIMLMSVSITTLALASAGFVWQQNHAILTHKKHQIEILAQATAYNLSATLAFEDQQAASDLLQALRVDEHILYAELCDQSGKVFSSYGTQPLQQTEQMLLITEPVMLDGTHLGDLAILSRLDGWFDLWVQKKNIIIAIILVALLAAFMIALWLQKGLTKPVRLMAKAMRRVSDGRDYTVRVKKVSDDELGQLVDGFNSMLKKIESHEHELDDKVQARTAALKHELDERHRAEQVRDSVFHALNLAGEGIMLADSHGQVSYINPAFSQITGYQLEGFNTEEFPLVQAALLNEAEVESMLSALKNEGSWQKEIQSRRQDGSQYPATLHAVHVKNDKASHMVFILRDMSAWEELENNLRHAQKMESIGILVGGIAHDFNNLLTGMLGNVELARMDYSDTNKVDAYLQNVEVGGVRAAEMIRKMLAFARKDRVEFKVSDLKAFFEESLILSKLAIPESVEVTVETPNFAMWGNIDVNQMEQVLLNLINNAVDAMEGRSSAKLRLALEHYKPDFFFASKYPDKNAEDYACIVVQDNGCGMDEAVQKQVFEPFFTTKEIGKGTGLGLSMIYGAIQRHDCIIDLKSTPDYGTTFRIYIPLCKVQKIEQDITLGSTPEVINHDGMLALLVDDDEDVRKVMQMMLDHFGYKTIVAQDGIEAVQLFEEYHHQIHIMVTDLSMPRMGGVEATRRVREINPDLPVIFVTGHDLGEALINDVEDLDATRLLLKPFRSIVLRQAIKELSSVIKV